MSHILGEALNRKWDNHVKINEERWNPVGLLKKNNKANFAHKHKMIKALSCGTDYTVGNEQ